MSIWPQCNAGAGTVNIWQRNVSYLRWKVGLFSILVIALAVCSPRAETKEKATENSPNSVSAARRQGIEQDIDLSMYQRIRDEGIKHSHVMQYASELVDGIGARLTGSPNMRRANEWTREQLIKMGCLNAHLEDWGEFGFGWQQLNTWVRMAAPDSQVMIAQSAPWSPSTNGTVQAEAASVIIQSEDDFAKYKGRLAGKIVLLGGMREVKPVDKPLFRRLDASDLENLASYPVRDEPNAHEEIKGFISYLVLRHKIGEFLAEEHTLAVIVPSRDASNGGGSGGTIFDDIESDMSWAPYKREQANPLPIAIMSVENYGRIYRLLNARVPVQLEMNVQTRLTGDHEHGFNTIAEIPGNDPNLKNQVVLLGAHLDSWASATGATDDGAGTVIAMEVMRILNALQVKPRRTIRIALWSGEEEGLLGSTHYVSQHFGWFPLSTSPDELRLPEFFRKRVGPLQPEPEHGLISGYFNVDNGGGRIRGIYLQENLAVGAIFRTWIEPLHDLGVTTVTARNQTGADQDSFDAVGIPAFQFIQDPLDYGSRTHHSNVDTFEELHRDDLAQAATVEAIFVYNTAMRDQMLPRKPIPKI